MYARWIALAVVAILGCGGEVAKKTDDIKTDQEAVQPNVVDEDQQRAIAAIEAIGGTAEKDFGTRGKPIYCVNLVRSRATDADLHQLAAFKSLRVLFVNGPGVTDAGLKQIAHLVSLEELDLTGTSVTDKGIKELAPLQRLKRLILSTPAVTDVGLKELLPLTNLQELYLFDNGRVPQVTDSGAKHISSLTDRCAANVIRDLSRDIQVGLLNHGV
jgi:hypothetical protein